MPIANVDLQTTFAEWLVRTNQLIVQGDQFLIAINDLYPRTNSIMINANTSYNVANFAYVQANTARSHANAAHLTANAAYLNSNAAFVQANTARTHANAAHLTANAAFNQANTSGSAASAAQSAADTAKTQADTARNHANASFAQANTARNQANAAFLQANNSLTAIANEVTSALDHYIVFTRTTSGNLLISNVATTKLYFTPSTGSLNATDFNSTSDQNLKTNVITVTDALDKVDQLRGVSFNWIENQASSYGVIAQEAEKVVPELITTNSNGVKSVNYSGFIALLIESIKELKARIELLEKGK